MARYNIIKKQTVDTRCFACGYQNEYGIQGEYYEVEGNFLIGVIIPKDIHRGYPGRLHGGVCSTIIDEAVGRAIMITHPDTWGVTMELKTRYRKPVPIGETAYVLATITEDGHHHYIGKAEIILQDGQVAVTGEAKYYKMKIDKIADDFSTASLQLIEKENEPQYFDIPDFKK